MPNRTDSAVPEGDPLWYKDAIIYELHVRAFCDSNRDGIGDFRGLTQRLGYLQDLGVTALWLLPFYPSPLKDDGYDIANYTDVHPAYGTLRDFKAFLKAAHRRGMRVITELVINHTSDQHAWFQRARRAKPGSRWRDFYVWSDSPDRYQSARIIFQDFETSNWSWDPVAHAYYWHRFYSHQPDLNFDHGDVRKAIERAMDFWLEMGVDGMRLDAVPYLYEREGTNCENLPETHDYLKQLRAHLDRKYQNRMFLAEANQWPEDAAAYFGDGDECHMNFHFPLMPRLFMAVRAEDRFPIIDILEQTPAIPENCHWAVFLRNHDELTLEMVTDEERDHMYRAYANDPQMRINLGICRRLAPLLGNNRRKIELMNGLLMAMPGTPVIYYGDEIGMGDNIYLGDRNGVRTPMQWSADRNAGFSQANAQKLYLPITIDSEYHYEAINVDAQHNNPHSLLWWMTRLIALRKRYQAFSRGTIEFLTPENREVLAFVRHYEHQRILVVANLSRFVHYAELDLRSFSGSVPVELFGQRPFPPIGELPYFLTLGPHAFYWFEIQPPRSALSGGSLDFGVCPSLTVAGDWDSVFGDTVKAELETIFSRWLPRRRWFAGKGRAIFSIQIIEVIPLNQSDTCGEYLLLLSVEYTKGEHELYAVPVAFTGPVRATAIRADHPEAVIGRLVDPAGKEVALLYDALVEPVVCTDLLDAIGRRRRFQGSAGELRAIPASMLRRIMAEPNTNLVPSAVKAEQSNTSVMYGDRLILKLFRRPEEGVNPDVEIGRFLAERTSFTHTAPLVGFLTYKTDAGAQYTLAALQEFVPNTGDAWRYTLDALRFFFERMITEPDLITQETQSFHEEGIEGHDLPMSEGIAELIGSYLPAVNLLGQRTAELHLALASDSNDPDFAPEPYNPMTQRSFYQSLRNLTTQNLQLLRDRVGTLPQPIQPEARHVGQLESDLLSRFRVITERPVTAMRIRCHGDYHLGQVLQTGNDFVIIDFEGEPARPLSERRRKRSALRDVAGMIRSFHYAAYAGVLEQATIGVVQPQQLTGLEDAAHIWYRVAKACFLRSYLETAGSAVFLPKSVEELRFLLDVFVLEKAVYELGYELNSRPDWVSIPLRGIIQQMERGS